MNLLYIHIYVDGNAHAHSSKYAREYTNMQTRAYAFMHTYTHARTHSDTQRFCFASTSVFVACQIKQGLESSKVLKAARDLDEILTKLPHWSRHATRGNKEKQKTNDHESLLFWKTAVGGQVKSPWLQRILHPHRKNV